MIDNVISFDGTSDFVKVNGEWDFGQDGFTVSIDIWLKDLKGLSNLKLSFGE